ncbi:hypothetical protein Tco_1413080 [Tanacetum coccineum]
MNGQRFVGGDRVTRIGMLILREQRKISPTLSFSHVSQIRGMKKLFRVYLGSIATFWMYTLQLGGLRWVQDSVLFAALISYKDVFIGNRMRDDIIDIQVKESLVERLKRCLLGKARNIHTLCNIWTLFKQEGLGRGIIHYIGGLSFICEWSSKQVAEDSLETNKVNLSSWCSNIDMWKEDTEPTGRLTWLELEGLLANARDAENVQKIGDKFGTVLEIDNMEVNGELKNFVGVLILTKTMDDISKCVPLKFNELLCLIRVVEDHNRSFLLNLPTESEYGASDDGSLNGDEDSDGVSDIVLGRREEGKYFSDDSREDECDATFGASPHLDYHVPEKTHAKSNDKCSCLKNVNPSVLRKSSPYLNETILSPIMLKTSSGDGPLSLLSKKMSFHILLDAFKKSGKTRSKKKSFAIGKDLCDDDFQLNGETSSGISGNFEVVGRKLGLIVDEDPIVASMAGRSSY